MNTNVLNVVPSQTRPGDNSSLSAAVTACAVVVVARPVSKCKSLQRNHTTQVKREHAYGTVAAPLLSRNANAHASCGQLSAQRRASSEFLEVVHGCHSAN